MVTHGGGDKLCAVSLMALAGSGDNLRPTDSPATRSPGQGYSQEARREQRHSGARVLLSPPPRSWDRNRTAWTPAGSSAALIPVTW